MDTKLHCNAKAEHAYRTPSSGLSIDSVALGFLPSFWKISGRAGLPGLGWAGPGPGSFRSDWIGTNNGSSLVGSAGQHSCPAVKVLWQPEHPPALFGRSRFLPPSGASTKSFRASLLFFLSMKRAARLELALKVLSLGSN